MTCVVVGGGLAGSLLALALREQGQPVTLVDDGLFASSSSPVGAASAISYGALPGWPLGATPLARLAAGASRRWRRLQRQHGDLGWRPRRLRLRGAAGWVAGLPWLPLPFAQVDTARLRDRLPAVLAAADVRCHRARAQQLLSGPGGSWLVQLSDGRSLAAAQLVLAAGGHCRQLWPTLPQRLRCSWAAVRQLAAYPGTREAGLAWLPAHFQRLALERRTPGLSEPQWVVDAGLVPWGAGALLGQHTLVRPGLEPGDAPAPAVVEQQLHAALLADPWAAPLAGAPGPLRQAAVAFCSDGLPLVGPVAGAPGLWVFSGFSAGFSQVPLLAPLLAQAMAAPAATAQAAQRRLDRLGVWPKE